MATLKTQIQLRRDTAANLANVVPITGEPVYATDTKKFSIGDGSTKFSELKDYGFIPDIPDEGDYARKQEGIFYVEGTSDATPFWTGTNERITSYYEGLTVAYKINGKSSHSGASLNINNLGNKLIECNNETGKVGDFNVGTVLLLVYKIIDGKGFWECVNYTDTKNTTGTSRLDGVKMYLIGSTNTSAYNVTNTIGGIYVDQYGSLYAHSRKVSLQGHRHDVSEVDNAATIQDIENAISNNRKIFCIDLLTDKTIITTELDLEGGQVDLNGDLLTMVYGTITSDYEEVNEVFGILISVNNGTTQTWFALVNNNTDEVAYQSGYEKIFDEHQQDSPLQNLNTLSNYHIEVFTCYDIVEIYDTLANTYYVDIEQARNNLTYLCTIRLNEDKTKWIVQS